MIEQLENEYQQEYRKKFNTLLNMTRVKLHNIEHKEGYDIITFYGGFNGCGDWSKDYIPQITNILKEFEGSWIIDLVNDCLDDLWALRIGVNRK